LVDCPDTFRKPVGIIRDHALSSRLALRSSL
jgi:hypothetical protein